MKILIYPLSLFLALTLFYTNLRSQVIDMKQTIDFINKSLEGKCELEDKKKYVWVKFFKNGEEYRRDKLYLNDLDYEKIHYSSEENGIVIPCRESEGDCIERRINHLKVIDQYSRILFILDTEDDRKITSLTEAFTHLVKLAFFSDLNRTEPFE